MTTTPGRRMVALGAAAFAVALAAAPAVAAARTAVAAPTSCAAPQLGATDVWRPVVAPPGASGRVSVQTLDDDGCVLLAADATGHRWRSANRGKAWTAEPGDPAVAAVRTESMQPRSGGRRVGAVLGSGPADATGAPPPLYVSEDDGETYEATTLTAGDLSALPVGLPPSTVPLRVAVADAATAVHYADDDVTAYVYVAGVTATAATGTQSTLLKSTDGGHAFAVVPGAATARLAPTAIAVNPTSEDEVWVNNTAAGGVGGGAWVSFDGGTTFESRCCPATTVRDIAIGVAPDGGAVIVLATDDGIMRSVDAGETWTTVTEEPATSVRMPPDDPGTMLAQTSNGVLLSSGSPVAFRPTRGLPAGCAPSGLRRDDRVPATFLAECGERTYALVLTAYVAPARSGQNPGGLPTLPGGGGSGTAPRQLTELATWQLPGSNTDTASIAFDGTVLYYDRATPGEIGMVRARDGKYLGTIHSDVPIGSLTVDLRRNELLVSSGIFTSATPDMFAMDLVTHQARWIGTAPGRVVSYDALTDGLAWVPELTPYYYQRARTGTGPGTVKCALPVGGVASTFVASGDGGGYVQAEDDVTVYRIDGACGLRGTYAHRVFSESNSENDAMSCDTQTYFPQPAIWIRDATPQTVTAYGVPAGYCPMPSRIDISAPGAMTAGAVAQLCAVLTNATNHLPAAHRGVTMSVEGVVAGHSQTDAEGRVCVPYASPAGAGGSTTVRVEAAFGGDSALYPAHADARIAVVDLPVAPPPPPPHPAAAAPPPPVPPVAVPPAPVPQPGAVPNPAPAPQAAQAQQAQMQAQSNPVAQGVVVPQKQQQPQLALAHAANQIGLDTNAFSVPRRRGRTPADLGVVAAALAVGCVAVAGAVRRQPAWQRGRSR